ncbi:hypothetical protein ILYODFUR_023922 [Ilyodon furcidens]|uniref:Uncharacterized protein n=1 Tax=Ilyodon furcidens TaxID=33524 RepID=A0ABV0UVP7_9TELE
MFKPYLVNRLQPSFLPHSWQTPASRRQDAGPSEPRRWQQSPGETSECGSTGGEIFFFCKCTHCMFCLIIMCNVAALTFYATIYDDIRCICNKSREKHVLGTASTAGSLCLTVECSDRQATLGSQSTIM